jgi:hypothetical protein
VSPTHTPLRAVTLRLVTPVAEEGNRRAKAPLQRCAAGKTLP